MEKEIRDRIKVLKEKILTLQKNNNDIIQQGKIMQQSIATNNTDILKCQGGVEELKKQIA